MCRVDYNPEQTFLSEQPAYSDWNCHLFGSADNLGMTFRPLEGNEPNRIQRYLSAILLKCTWKYEPL